LVHFEAQPDAPRCPDFDKGRLVDPIRVLVTRMPTMLRDIVRAALGSQPDLLLVADVPETVPIARAVQDLQAEIVVVGIDAPGDLHAFDDLLYEIPDTCLVGVTRDGHHAALARLTPQHEVVNEVSAGELLDVVRAAAAGPRARVGARRDA
jgi:hypothetical protein